MNNKELFYLFLKYSNVVISRYQQLSVSPKRYVDSRSPKIRRSFEEELQSSKDFINKEIKSSGYSSNGYRYNFPDCYFYFGKQGWNKYGVFSLISLYKQAKWNISVIEKYKENIVWAMLFEYGDFFFEEEDLNRYEQYIPWTDYFHGDKRFVPFFDNGTTIKYGTTLSNFKNVGILSEAFIKTHISVIDIWGLCSTGCFKVTKELIKIFYNGCSKNIIYDFGDAPGGLAYNERITISSDILLYIAKDLKINNWEQLLPKIALTHENFLDFYLYNPQCMEVFFKLDFGKRREIVLLIEQNKNLRDVVSSDFCKKLWQGGENSNLPYTYDFSVDLIKKNLLLWNKQSFEYFHHMQRTPDTNYHHYKRVTTWDVLAKQETILLTYDLCKFLISLDVVIGGSYVLEDGNYHTDDIPNHPVNALKLFRFRDVMNNEEFEKIAHDKEIVNFLFANAEPPRWGQDYYIVGNIVDKLIINFFKDFSFEEFKEIAAEQKNQSD